MAQKPTGWELPAHQSLIRPDLVAGVTRELAVSNGTMTAAVAFALETYVVGVIGILVHLIMIALTKKDPQFAETFRRARNLEAYYD